MKEKNMLPSKPINRAHNFNAAILLSLFGVLLSGCYTPPKQTVYNGPRFQEEAYVNVVLQFMTWDSILITRPEIRDNGFLQLYSRDNLSPMLTGPQVGHEMAVVMIGWTYQDEQLAQVVTDWKTLLNGCGFKRVVCLRAGPDNKIDGLPIIDDTSLPVDATKKTASL
ncbi:MAG: hypothetical protein HY298_01620 [Verrucomicrobia bacterium]|nr:hypothetical protein [Verrucomicrobiota bacterium]